MNLMLRNVIQDKKNNYQCHWECKKLIKHQVCKEDCAWNPSTCAYEYKKDFEIGKYLKKCTCITNHVMMRL